MKKTHLLLSIIIVAGTSIFSACDDAQPVIPSEEYINQDFQYKFDYPSGWELEIFSNQSFPGRESVVFVAQEGMEFFLSIQKELPTIENMINQKYYLVDAYDAVKGFLLIEKGNDYFNYLQSLEGEPVYYHEDNIYLHNDIYYTVQFRCSARYYFENEALPPELELIFNSFGFLS